MRAETGDGRPNVICVAGRRVVHVLAEMDVRTTLLGDPTPLDLACVVDLPLDVDLGDWAATEALLRGLHDARPFGGVVNVYDAHLPLAGYLAARLGVAGPAMSAAMNCDSKLRMRLALAGGGVPVPAHHLVGDPDEAQAAASRLDYPVLVKKVTGARGKGTRVCRGPEEVAAAVVALRTEDHPDLLVEEYIDGPEYAVQTVTAGGVTDVAGILAQHTAPGARPLEIGYDHPSGLGPEKEAELGAFVAEALRVLGLENGVAHTQVRLGPEGPVVVNVSLRPPGGRLCEVTEAVSGVDLVRAAVEVTLGRPVTRRSPVARYVMYRCLTFDQAGAVEYDPRALAEVGEAPAPVVSMDVEPGQTVFPVDHAEGGVYGRVVVYADDETRLVPAYQDAVGRLRPRVGDSST
ncbi:ATP-grasp domain-containing protein [Sphaerisporangium sp. NPDC005289]|uniref:ATP-grasp domain-containing protein n=1 Tax=Sphaerisporangium sp. NPDC005289 TaxID=3155247 RepID=UPI0033A4E5EA